jgi:hypothetical protein
MKARMTGGGFPAFRHEQKSRLMLMQKALDP